MYTILVNDDNSLVVSVKERIMQRSKLVDTLHFLANEEYKEKEMKDFTVTMEYLLPVSKEYRSEILNLTVDEETGEPELYKDMLEYKVPFDTALTSEHGNVEVQLTFTKTELDEKGNATQYVRKTSVTNITIVPISAWSDIISDSALSAVDQRILKVNEQIKAMDELGELMATTKADNIKLTEETEVDEDGTETTRKVLQLTANGEEIGDSVALSEIVSEGTDELTDTVGSDGVFKVVSF